MSYEALGEVGYPVSRDRRGGMASPCVCARTEGNALFLFFEQQANEPLFAFFDWQFKGEFLEGIV